jgi:hypothetical protein
VRWKKHRFQEREVVEGTITAAELRRKFKIPDDAEITITMPFLHLVVPAATHSMGTGDDEVQGIRVRWERIK